MSATEQAFKNSMASYGKNFTAIKQIKILHSILSDGIASQRIAENDPVHQKIKAAQQELDNTKNLKRAIEIINKLIAELEQSQGASEQALVQYFKEKGVYRILHHKPKIRGEILPQNDILNITLRNGFIGVGVSAAAILFFLATSIIGAPFWLAAISVGLFTGATAYLSGILYGVINDLFATKANLPYFLLGHQPQQLSLLATNDKAAQGIAWGVSATFGLTAIAAVVFAVAATITAFFTPIATFLLPAMIIAMPLIAIGAEFYARKKTRNYIEYYNKEVLPNIEQITLDSTDNERRYLQEISKPLEKQDPQIISECNEKYQKYIRDFFLHRRFNRHPGLNDYQHKGLAYMCPTAKDSATWLSNSDRNIFGFIGLPLIGLGVLIGLIVLSSITTLFPPLLFTLILPTAIAGAAVLGLTAAGVYMHNNRNTQVDDRYKLDFTNNEIDPNLYLDEDMDYIDKLTSQYEIDKVSVEAAVPAAEPVHTPRVFTAAEATEAQGLSAAEEILKLLKDQNPPKQ